MSHDARMETRSLKTPPLLLGAALVFWGWQTGLLPAGIGLALVLEACRLVPARWEFGQTDLDRIWNLTTFLLIGGLLLSIFGLENFDLADTGPESGGGRRDDALMRSSRSVLLLLQWLPMVFAPVVLAQAWNRASEMPLSTFSWWLRRQRSRRDPREESGFNPSHAYLGTALLAASAANQAHWFFPVLAGLVIWGLWVSRPRRFSRATWMVTMALVIGTAYAGQLGLRQLQRLVESVDTLLLARFGGNNFDIKETRTSLGALGRLKMSGKVVLRIETNGKPAPELLREATYTLFKTPLWFNTASRREFQNVRAEDDGTTWVLQPRRVVRQSLSVWRYLSGNTGLLPLPGGVARLEDLPAFSLATNALGAVKVMGPGLINYNARFDAGPGIDSRPTAEDLEVPQDGPDAAALTRVVDQLRLRGTTAEQARRTVGSFFRRGFSYSLWLPDAHRDASNTPPLAAFLLEKHAGHCEYFATATVLLLREAGVPARYATGYIVQERSGDGYVVRERHAHAWCLAWINGAWQDFDTTPADGSEEELGLALLWEPFLDFWSWLWFEFSKWRFSRSGLRPYFLVPLVPPLGLLVFRLFFRKQWNRFRHPDGKSRERPPWPGSDSEFYRIERHLATRGHPRSPDEPAVRWLDRLEKIAPGDAQSLRALLLLHNRLRFDPAGLDAEGRTALRVQSQHWLEERKGRG